MRSGWWWGTDEWERYQVEYYAGKERPIEYKSSPLANDHDLIPLPPLYRFENRISRVIDLQSLTWGNLRKSYHSIINSANDRCRIGVTSDIEKFKKVHIAANGMQSRPDETYEIQGEWIKSANGLLVGAHSEEWLAFAYWIIYQGSAYYASGPSIEKNIQHAVIWRSLLMMRDLGVRYVDMGQIEGGEMTKKERDIALFKRGFGGENKLFVVVKGP